MKFCEDLEVDPEDVVLLALAYELKSPRMAIWTKQGWVEGWKKLSCVHVITRGSWIEISFQSSAVIIWAPWDRHYLVSGRSLAQIENISPRSIATHSISLEMKDNVVLVSFMNWVSSALVLMRAQLLKQLKDFGTFCCLMASKAALYLPLMLLTMSILMAKTCLQNRVGP